MLMDAARKVKHSFFLGRRASHRGVIRARNAAYSLYDAARPFVFDKSRYPLSFVVFDAPPSPEVREVKNVIYCFWTGDNELTPNRRRCLETIRLNNPATPVVLVTRRNLGEYVLEGHPLHPAFEHLSLNHRSDYLRCYFMHHHGGGYSDIKECFEPWLPAITSLQAQPEKWALGYTEVSSDLCAWLPDNLGVDIRRHFRSLIGNGAFVVRPGTPLTTEWYAEVHRRLDYYASLLAEHPGDVWGSNPGYPVPWTGLQSLVFQPVCMKYLDRLIHDDSIKPSFENHR